MIRYLIPYVEILYYDYWGYSCNRYKRFRESIEHRISLDLNERVGKFEPAGRSVAPYGPPLARATAACVMTP